MNNLMMSQHGGKLAAPPPTVGVISVMWTESNSHAVTWNNSDFTFPGGFASFKLYQDGVLVDTVTSRTLYYSIYYSSFVEGQVYEYYIRAYDQLGQWTQTNSVFMTAVETIPPTIGYMSVSYMDTFTRISFPVSDNESLYYMQFIISRWDQNSQSWIWVYPPNFQNFSLSGQTSGILFWDIPYSTMEAYAVFKSISCVLYDTAGNYAQIEVEWIP